MKNDRPYADQVNYWRTSRTSPATWLDKAMAQIARAGGIVEGHGYLGQGDNTHLVSAAYMILFSFGDDHFKITWPVLQPKNTKDIKAARIQAATALYHEVKSMCVKRKFVGTRKAFVGYLLLPDGLTVDMLPFNEAIGLPSPEDIDNEQGH